MFNLGDILSGKFHALSDGKHMRYVVLEPEGPARGTILIAPGRREFIEKKYIELGEEFLQRGFRLIFFEWRGQGLSDRMLTGSWRQRDHITDFEIHLKDLRGFFKAIVQPFNVQPILVCGHSMGSHLLLRWLAEDQPPDVMAAIVTAPMLALAPRTAHGISGVLSRAAAGLAFGESYAPYQHDYGPAEMNFAGNPLSQDPERFAVMEKYFVAYPDMTVGGVTWDWLLAALRSMHEIQKPSCLAQIRVPVLAMTGSKDRVTPPRQLNRYLPFIPDLQNVSIADALHDVMNESEMYRAEAWRQIDAFLERVFPSPRGRG